MTSTRSPRATNPLGALARPIVRGIVGQFARPHGPLGSVAGRIMAKRGSNVERNLWIVELLELEPWHRVLEVGPGPGVALAAVLDVVTDGAVVAVDHSTVMLRQSERRNAEAVATGRLTLVEGSAHALPTGVGNVDRIYAMNVWQFFGDQEAVLGQLVERLRPGGMLALGYQPRHRGAEAADTDAARRCLADQFANVGLHDVQDHVLDLSPVPVTCVTGRKL